MVNGLTAATSSVNWWVWIWRKQQGGVSQLWCQRGPEEEQQEETHTDLRGQVCAWPWMLTEGFEIQPRALLGAGGAGWWYWGMWCWSDDAEFWTTWSLWRYCICEWDNCCSPGEWCQGCCAGVGCHLNNSKSWCIFMGKEVYAIKRRAPVQSTEGPLKWLGRLRSFNLSRFGWMK